MQRIADDYRLLFRKSPYLIRGVLLHVEMKWGNEPSDAGGAEDSPRPVGDKGEPQAGENTEEHDRFKGSSLTLFSTGKRKRRRVSEETRGRAKRR